MTLADRSEGEPLAVASANTRRSALVRYRDDDSIGIDRPQQLPLSRRNRRPTERRAGAFGRGWRRDVRRRRRNRRRSTALTPMARHRRSGAFRLCDEGAGGRLGEDRAASCRPRSFALVMRRLSPELHVYRAQRAEGRSMRGGVAGAWRSGVARTGSIARHDHRLCSFPGWRP
jgi:hypothetical protein